MTIHRALRRVRRQGFLHTQVIFHLAMVLLNQWVTCLVIEQDEERAQYQLIIGSGILTSSQEIGIGKPACVTDGQTKGINKRCAEPPIVMKLAVISLRHGKHHKSCANIQTPPTPKIGFKFLNLVLIKGETGFASISDLKLDSNQKSKRPQNAL